MDVRDLLDRLHRGEPRCIARAISLVEDRDPAAGDILAGLDRVRFESALVLGITGPPGAGKSTLTGGLIRLLRERGERIGIVAIDPSSPVSGGAILGDRIRMMSHALDPEVVVRSMATRGRLGGLCAAAGAAVRIMAAGGCRTVIIETVGVGQTEMDIIGLADLTVMVLAPGFGDDIQAMKAGILEVADLIVINKADRPEAEKLALDLGTVFSDETQREERLLRTVASQQQGLDLLLARIMSLEERLRGDQTLLERRHRAFAAETMDWALELLRPRIARLLPDHQETDPRLAAAEIVAKLERSSDHD
ncbi:MAG: methylmalonyl Co-A mutase-associated GTPase MeaB [Desulfobulbaceae bacterium]